MDTQGLKRRTQGGQSLVEYVLVLSTVMMALSSGDPSTLEQLAQVIKDNYRGYSYAISMTDMPDTKTSAAAKTLYLANGGEVLLVGKATNVERYSSALQEYYGKKVKVGSAPSIGAGSFKK